MAVNCIDGLTLIERRDYISNFLKSCSIDVNDNDYAGIVRILINIKGREHNISTVFSHDFRTSRVVMEVAWYLSDDEKRDCEFIPPDDDALADDKYFCIRKYYSIGEYIDIILKMHNHYNLKN